MDTLRVFLNILTLVQEKLLMIYLKSSFKEGHLIVYPSWFKREDHRLIIQVLIHNKIEDPTNIDYDHQHL